MKTKYHFIFLLLASLVSTTACKTSDRTAILLATQHGTKLEVREGSEIIDPIKMVRANTAQFGVASSDRVLRENATGGDLVILATACYRSPVVFLSHPALKINSPAGFKGHRIGIQAGTNTELVFKALIGTVPLSEKDMNVVESGFGTTNFETGRLDVLGAFDYDEPIQLTIKQVPYDLLEPEKFGVHFVGTVYFTSRYIVEHDPQLVQSFMDTLVDGWTHALAHPVDAIDLVATRFPAVDKKKEVMSLERGTAFFAGEDGHLLYASENRWNQMGKQLISLGVLKQFIFANNVDYRFLQTATKRLPSQ
jgi:ABC-type nitrate/sulfonate/bicarbonate transport system substrate-binding protein